MPVSGLVLSVADASAVTARLAERPDLEVGPVCGHRLPVVLDSPSVADDRETLAWIEAVPGVTSIEIAFVDFSDVASVASPELRRMGNPAHRRGSRCS